MGRWTSSPDEGLHATLSRPNGAGKSTSIKMFLGLVRPIVGHALLLGRPLGTREVRARIALLPEHFRFYDWLSAVGRLCGHDS